MCCFFLFLIFFFQAEDGIRDLVRSRGLGDVYKRQALELISGDLLEVKSDAVLLTIDGVKPGMEGNIARQFARRFPEDWQYLQRDIPVSYTHLTLPTSDLV